MTQPTCPDGPIEDCTDEGCTHFFTDIENLHDKLDNALDNAEKVLERLLKTSSWVVSDDTELSATTIIAQALQETATQKLKEGMERALEIAGRGSEEINDPVVKMALKFDKQTQYFAQGAAYQKLKTFSAIREEMEKLTPKE